MTDKIEVTPSSGNVFRDLGFADPEAELAKADARLAAQSQSPESPGEDAGTTACLILDKLGWKHRDGQWESPDTEREEEQCKRDYISAMVENEVWKVAQLAVTLRGRGMAIDEKTEDLWCGIAVATALKYFGEARRQVTAEAERA